VFVRENSELIKVDIPVGGKFTSKLFALATQLFIKHTSA